VKKEPVGLKWFRKAKKGVVPLDRAERKLGVKEMMPKEEKTVAGPAGRLAL